MACWRLVVLAVVASAYRMARGPVHAMTARDVAADAAGTLLVSARDLRGAVSEALRRRHPDKDEEELSQTAQALVEDADYQVCCGASVSAFADALALHHAMETCEDAYMGSLLRDSLKVLADAYRLFGIDGVFTSFNGGKDAVVIMQLSRAVFAKACVSARRVDRARMIFFELQDEFEEVRAFVRDSEKACDLDLRRYSTGFVEGLTQCIAEEHGHLLGFVLGTRRGDPNCGRQGTFEPSSNWMPPFMRVNPVLEWEYGHIWHFIRSFQLPYVSLYDQGYTSLGKKADTAPNPALAKPGSANEYLPAYMLRDWTLERAGRRQKAVPEAAQAADCDVSGGAAPLLREGETTEKDAPNAAQAAADRDESGGAAT